MKPKAVCLRWFSRSPMTTACCCFRHAESLGRARRRARQLGNRVQHALRAFTPRDQKAVKAAAETFRQNPKLKVETVLTQLAVGEALVSMLDESGSPQIVERAKIVPPRSQVGAITADQRKEIIASSVIAGHYEKAIDRESAYEKLQARAGEKAQTAGAPPVGPSPATPDEEKPSLLAEAL